MAGSQSAIMRPLGGVARAFAAMRSRLYQAPPTYIAGVNEANWPTANQPIQTIAPDGAQPLAWGYYQGINQNITPRSDSELSFADLRALATYPLARLCIENIKDQISSLKWTFQLREQPGESLKERRKRQENDQVIPLLDQFFRFPDGETPWSDWIRPLLEDLLVIDAPSILIQRTLTGKIVKLRVLDGAEILRLIDDQGFTPAPPSPAYTQLWEGIPRIMLTTDQLLYRPRNIVPRNTASSHLYGQSPTEQMKIEITTGMERLRYVLAFYTEGGVPGMVRMVPPGVQPDRIKEAMQWQNSELAGQLAKRRQWRDIQSFSGTIEDGPKDTIHEFKEPILADSYDELHIRKMAFAYGTSAQRLLKAMNRASAQAGQEAAQEEGTIPWVIWLKSTLDAIIQRKMGHGDYEAVPDTAVELDPSKQMEIDTGYVKAGIFTVNERRDMRGAEPRPEPEANGLMVITATGAVPLAGAIERTQEQHDADIEPPPAPVIAPPGTPRAQPDTPTPGVPTTRPKRKPQSKKKLTKAEQVRIDPQKKSAALALAEAKLYAHVVAWLHHSGKEAAETVTQARKAASDPRDEDEIVNAIMAEIAWEELADIAQPELELASIEGASLGLQELTVTDQAVISAVNAAAREYARNRAASLVGMKWVNGELVQNPNAQMAITESSRNMLREAISEAFSQDTPVTDLAAVIRDSAAFSEKRARLIAENEVRQAQIRGNLASWQQAGVVLEYRWQLSGDHSCCDICDTFAEGGPYPLAEAEAMLDETHPLDQCILVATKIKGMATAA